MGSDAAFRVFSAADVARRWTAAAAVPVTPNSLIPSRSLRPSFYLSTRVIPHAWLRGAAHAGGRTDDLVSWLTREIRRSRRRRSAKRGERMSGRAGGEKGATRLQLSQILRHLPRTRSTGHSDPLNPGSTTCLSLPLYIFPCNLLFSLSRHPSVVPPYFPAPFRLRQELNRDTAN